MRGDLSIKVIRANTGREGMHLVDSVPTAHHEVQAFVLQLCDLDALDWSELLTRNTVADTIHEQFQAASTTGIRGMFYRSCAFSVDAQAPSSADLRAPPVPVQSAGRYNEGGRRVLYLSTDSRVAALECSATPDKPRVYVQRFDLNLPHRRIVRLELDMEARFPHLHYLMLDSEYLPTRGHEFANVRNPYRATHFLAYLCSIADVSAIEYPSVRGGAQGDRSGVNVAVFGEAVEEAHAQMLGLPEEWERTSLLDVPTDV